MILLCCSALLWSGLPAEAFLQSQTFLAPPLSTHVSPTLSARNSAPSPPFRVHPIFALKRTYRIGNVLSSFKKRIPVISLIRRWRKKAIADAEDTSSTERQDLELEGNAKESRTTKQPEGPRWAVATTDLSGVWKPIVTPAFKKEYDTYLKHCGEGLIFRKALVSAIGFGKEVYDQRNGGRELSITGSSPIGGWERVLVASGSDNDTSDYEPAYSVFKDPDGDTVQVEAWWENNGTVHKSWLRNKPLVLGGEFESTRYLLPDDNDILVCEAVFHPPANVTKFQKDSVEWRFRRECEVA